jgi:hypothetical protein
MHALVKHVGCVTSLHIVKGLMKGQAKPPTRSAPHADCKETRLCADLEKARYQYTDKEEKEMRERMEFARGSVEGVEGDEGMEDVLVY